jgi:hypothetical protein
MLWIGVFDRKKFLVLFHFIDLFYYLSKVGLCQLLVCPYVKVVHLFLLIDALTRNRRTILY